MTQRRQAVSRRGNELFRHKKAPKGLAPSLVYINTKYPQNIGAAVRTCSCYGIEQMWFTGTRVSLEPSEGYRLPREERMRGYQDVEVINYDYPFDQFNGATIVGIEVQAGAETLPHFEHPENAVYVFGPEDGSLPKMVRGLCHRFVAIPTRHCLNLSVAAATVLYDRQAKLNPDERIEELLKSEERGFVEDATFVGKK